MRRFLFSLLAFGLFCGTANAKVSTVIFEEDALKFVLKSNELEEILNSEDLQGFRLRRIEFEETEGNLNNYRQTIKMSYYRTAKAICTITMELGLKVTTGKDRITTSQPTLLSSDYECVSSLY